MEKSVFTAASQIPESAGKGSVTAAHISSTINLYRGLVVVALTAILLKGDPRLQNAALALLFPGGGFIGLGGFWVIGLPVTLYASRTTP
jgi:hypothetical protein